MKRAMAMRLVKALRSGEFRQGPHNLRDGDHYCCLGVACEIAGSPAQQRRNGMYSYEAMTASLPEAIRQKYGFYSASGCRRDGQPIVIDGSEYNSLASANDMGCSFLQIADYVEANYKFL